MSDADTFIPECGHPCRDLFENETHAGLSPEYQWQFRKWCCRCGDRTPCSLCAPLEHPEDKRRREEYFEIGRQMFLEWHKQGSLPPLAFLDDENRSHPDRMLAYARWMLSQDPAHLSALDGGAVQWLRSGDGQGQLKVLEEWERDVMANKRTRAVEANLLVLHDHWLRRHGQMLPQPVAERAAGLMSVGVRGQAAITLRADLICLRLFGRMCPDWALIALACLPAVIAGFVWWRLVR